MRELKIFITFLAFLSTLFLSSQTVEGLIEDEDGFPIPDVEITNVRTQETTLSDLDGKFSITAEDSDPITFYSFEFAEQTVMANNEFLTVVLKQDQLDEIVVIGYGEQREELVSSSYTHLDSEEIMENDPIRIYQAIQGKAPGVQVNSTSGSTGAGYTIRIRGITTNGNNSPLVIIDGVNMGNADLSIVDPNDIESFDIIKDASAAIYGVQGANGVILITTKSGKKGKTRFSYSGNYTIQETSNVLDLMNGQEYAGYVNESYAADGGTIPYPNFLNSGPDTDWQAQLFDTAGMTSHNLSASGGSDVINYTLSGSYLDQDGIIARDKSNLQRWTLRNNLDIKLTEKLKANTFLLYTNNQVKGLPQDGRGSPLYYAYNASPLTPVYDGTDGSGPSRGYSYITQGSEMVNPLAVINNTFNETKVNRFTGKIELNYEILKGLDITSRYNFNTSEVRTRSYSPYSYYGPNKVINTVGVNDQNEYILDRPLSGQTTGNGIQDVFSTVYEGINNYYSYQWETFVNYDFNIKTDHHFTALLGMSLQSTQGKFLGDSGYLTETDNWENAYLEYALPYNPDTDYLDATTTFNSTSDRWEKRLSSVFARFQYDYREKYLFSAIVRRDGSSDFGPNNRFGYFPSFSAGWNVDKESFFTVGFINNLKIRGSWGVSGNDQFPSLFPWIGLIQNPPAEATYPFGDQLYFGSAVGKLANPNLKWEKNHQTDIGFDMTLFKKTTTFTLDYFSKKTEDLLLSPEVPAGLGAIAGGSSAPSFNAGTVRNNGVEFAIGYTTNWSKAFHFNVGYNFTYLKNEVLDVAGSPQFGGLFGLGTVTSRMTVGAPIGAFYGYETDGVFQNQAEIDSAPYQEGAQVGDIRYKDLNGDGVIDFGSEDDVKMIGNPIPDFLMGFNFGADYKNFDFSVSLYASIGNDIVRSYERFQPDNNRLAYYLDRWTGEGTSNDVPRASSNSSNNNLFSDFFVEDGSFLRIQNIQVGYDLTDFIGARSSFSKARIYFAVNNAYTFTKYLGYNPEINNSSPVGAGIDYGQYPITRNFVSGLQLNF